MIWARWAGVMGVPMKWEIARIFVVGTGGSGFCAEAAPSGVIGFFMAVAPYSSFGILLYGSSVQAGILRLVRGLMYVTNNPLRLRSESLLLEPVVLDTATG